MTTDNAAGGTPRTDTVRYARKAWVLEMCAVLELDLKISDDNYKACADILEQTRRELAQAKHDLAREVTIAAHECAERVRLQGELAQANEALEKAYLSVVTAIATCPDEVAVEFLRGVKDVIANLKSPAQGEKINAAGRGKP